MTGSVKLWTVDASNSSSNANVPGNIELGSHVVNLHFSPTYKELLSTLGPLPEAALEASSHQTWPRNNLSNSLAVHSYPSLRQITSFPISEDAVRGSVLNPSATKIVVAIPGQNKLKVFDTWGKKKEIKRQSSFLGNAIR
jgi:cell division cycle protein 20 (cofactor of APC complex)